MTISGEAAPTGYKYDPCNPTPNTGGAMNATLAKGTGSVDNRKLEERADVLTFAGKVLSRNMEIIGPVSAELYIRSPLKYTDFFVCLCNVTPDGRSMNICDAILSLSPDKAEYHSEHKSAIILPVFNRYNFFLILFFRHFLPDGILSGEYAVWRSGQRPSKALYRD